jgi:hypothetical protein
MTTTGEERQPIWYASRLAAVPASPAAHEQVERNGVSTERQRRFAIMLARPRSEENHMSRQTNQGGRPMFDRTGPYPLSPATKTPNSGQRRYRKVKRSSVEIQRAVGVVLVAGGLAVSGWAVVQLPDVASRVELPTSSYANGYEPDFRGELASAQLLDHAEKFDPPSAPTFTLPPKPTFTLPPAPTFTLPPRPTFTLPVPTTRVPIER